jgi:outer membrane protein OmpA-like peptidoglycan-associated protein
MGNTKRLFSTTGPLALIALIALSGCATKRYVREQVATVDPKIAEVTNANRENAERIDAVDRRAQQGITAAGAADQRAGQAQQAAQAANQAAQQVANRVTTVESRFNSIDNYSPAGQPVTVTFPVNSSALNDQAMASLDQVANQVANQTSGYLIEVQGFTDATGDETYNIALSQRRAEAVLRYLVGKNVALSRVSIVGLGEDRPAADNTTRQGREQNRRVEVRILRSAQGRATN